MACKWKNKQRNRRKRKQIRGTAVGMGYSHAIQQCWTHACPPKWHAALDTVAKYVANKMGRSGKERLSRKKMIQQDC